MALQKPLIFILFLLSSTLVNAQNLEDYKVPLTEHGQPDFQGVWSTGSLTTLQRPNGVSALVVSQEDAQTMASNIMAGLSNSPGFDLESQFIDSLARVKGEFRTSIIVQPVDGQLPYSQRGRELRAQFVARNNQKFDHPEQRPLNERCIVGRGGTPIIAQSFSTYFQFVQTKDHIVINAEDAGVPRIIYLNSDMPDHAFPSYAGYSVGYWDDDTLVVDSKHLRTYGSRMSENTRVTERFTRVSDDELHYYHTVEDEILFTQKWSGEYSFTRSQDLTWEYACHEGNYLTMRGILLGGQQ